MIFRQGRSIINSTTGRLQSIQPPRAPRVIAVSALKNSGKTTLLAGLIPVLKARGLSIALIKHDGHDFEPDVPGTDSSILRAAGAGAVAVYSDRRYMITAERPRVLLEDIIVKMTGYDLILLEGAKYSLYPKIEIVRGAVSRSSVCDPATLLALATDTDLTIDGVPSVPLDDYETLAAIVTDYLRTMPPGNFVPGR